MFIMNHIHGLMHDLKKMKFCFVYRELVTRVILFCYHKNNPKTRGYNSLC